MHFDGALTRGVLPLAALSSVRLHARIHAIRRLNIDGNGKVPIVTIAQSVALIMRYK